MSKFVNFMVGAIVGAGAGVAGLIYLANKKRDKCCSCDENSDCNCKCHDKIDEIFDENGDPVVSEEEVEDPVEEVVVEVPDEETTNVRHRCFIIRRKKRNTHRKHG